ncbi:hypothetical protein [uncultured Rubinisphaera sp.]|uniref:hypothetical protein n=3 Tax=Rubinisphaera TaxID=1649490 RepID=UPI0030D7A8A2|tara:strand:+ start:4238 stop:5032 length:795 start_codon:yes stop_codon:yes gene_type:complete
MSNSIRISRSLYFFAIAIFCFVVVSEAQESSSYVKLQLRDGRKPVGKLVPQADSSEWIVLESSSAQLAIVSRFHKTRVQTIERIDPVIVIEPEPGMLQSKTEPGNCSNENSFPEASSIQSISIRAAAKNWDRDVEADGVSVQLIALDTQQNRCQLRGSVSFTLYAVRYRPQPDEQRFVKLGDWTVRLSQDLIDQQGDAHIQLPWRNQRPDVDSEFLPLGLLKARLNVSGVGSFEASDANVPLREWSQFRDDAEIYEGSQYHFDE